MRSQFSDLLEDSQHGLAVRTFVKGIARAAGFNMPEWPTDPEAAYALFSRLNNELAANGIVLTRTMPHSRNHHSVEMAFHIQNTSIQLFMVQQRRNGDWYVSFSMEREDLKAYVHPGAWVSVRTFLDTIYSSVDSLALA